MIEDLNTLCSSDQAITADAVSDYSVDLGGNFDVGPGTPILPFLRVTEAFNTLTSLNISVITSAAAALTSPTKLFTVNVLLAGLTLNTPIALPPVPAGGAQRYLGFDFDVVGSNPSTGKITAGFVVGKPQNAANKF